MLVYQSVKQGFMSDVENDVIVTRIKDAFEQKIHRAAPREVLSWNNSMQYMYKVLNTSTIPDDCGVAIEFGVPYTNSRIDFLLSGRGESERAGAAVIIELKQWTSLDALPGQDGIVRTFVGGAHRNVAHPSYQAWSYSRMIEDYNEAVRDRDIDLLPCAYLHNYKVSEANDPLLHPMYDDYLSQAPVFCQGDVLKLRDFICESLRQGDNGRVLYEIESGKLRPSKSLQNALASMLDGNAEFVMLDDQKVIFEEAVRLAKKSRDEQQKHVLIVQGGPGTGKSVVAVNLLVQLTGLDMVTQYVSKNSAPRNVYSKLLQSSSRGKTYIKTLFQGPGRFYEHRGAPLDVVVVDEAHRLNEKSGLYGNLGENQIKEIIAASRFSVFFIDESQRVTIKDIGAVAEIRALALEAGAEVHDTELYGQFRCNGSNGYLDWLDDVLGIEPASEVIADLDYDFRVFDDPSEMLAAIEVKNSVNNRSRVVAGYCWEWPTSSKPNPDSPDVVIPGFGFAKSWNLSTTETWAIDSESIDHIGCVHTAQGLEFDYVGVIVGDDLRFEDGGLVTDHTKRAKSDASLKGIKSMMKTESERASRIADEIIRNTYRVLMTRGMKGCYVFCTDPSLRAHLKDRMPANQTTYPSASASAPIAAESLTED
ncbi:MAG TPA: DUF2075 domain-containing protein [Coriobacteriia bacterium]|nr:DUF2075 domain-containing protein [Coriobacteriia bacterium]